MMMDMRAIQFASKSSKRMSRLKEYLRPFYVPVSNLIYELFRKPRRYRYLFDTIRATKAIRIAEIGTWTGGRAGKMIAVARATSPDKQIEYYGFDLFEEMTDELFETEVSKRPPTELDVEQRLKMTGAEIHLYKGDTKATLPRVIASLPRMDFVYIDGGHALDTIQNDWNAVSHLMHSGTVVLFDDYWHNRVDAGCKPLIDSLDRSTFEVEVLPIVDAFHSDQFGALEISFARVTLRR